MLRGFERIDILLMCMRVKGEGGEECIV